MRFLKVAIACLLLLSVFACKKPQGFDYKDMKNFRVANWGMDRTTVAMDFVFFNPNNFGVDLKKVDCDIYINQTFVGKFVLDTLMHIPRNADFIMPASMEVDMKNIFKNTLNVIFSNEILIGAKGSTRVGKGGIFVTVPFNYEGRHKLDMF